MLIYARTCTHIRIQIRASIHTQTHTDTHAAATTNFCVVNIYTSLAVTNIYLSASYPSTWQGCKIL